MSTNSFKPILDSNAVIDLAKPVINIASPALREAVNYATNLWERCRLSNKGKAEEAIPVHVLFLHVIQMVDSSEVLISNSCIEPANVLLRSAWEARLYIAYILERKSKQRALAWQYNRISQEIRTLEAYDLSHPKGKETRQMWSEEPMGDIIPFPPSEQIPKEIEKLKDLLKRPIFAEIPGEYKKLSGRGRPIEWYALFGGPENLKQLARYLKVGTSYGSLYRSSSEIIHAGNMSHVSLPSDDNSLILGPIRNPLNIAQVSSTALTIMMETMELVLRTYRPDELASFGRWGVKEISPALFSLTRVELGHLKYLEGRIDGKSKKQDSSKGSS